MESSDDSDSAAEDATRLTAALVAFLALSHNCKCADCATPFAAPNEAWASLNLGVLVCKRCAATVSLSHPLVAPAILVIPSPGTCRLPRYQGGGVIARWPVPKGSRDRTLARPLP